MRADDGTGARLDIEPEPDGDERAALEQVLVRVRKAVPSPGRSAWWREGVRENVGGGDADERRLWF